MNEPSYDFFRLMPRIRVPQPATKALATALPKIHIGEAEAF